MKFFFTLLLSLAFCHAQAQQYTLKNYKALEGLPQSQVNMVVEDANGYLWIATHGGGLARFDGHAFTVYTTLDGLLSNIITFLKIDSKQNIWIVHPRGITKFDGKVFTKFQQPGDPSAIKRIRRVFQQGDSLFFISVPGTLGKIYRDSVYYWNKAIQPGKNIAYSHLLPTRETLLYLNDSSFILLNKDGRKQFKHTRYFNRLYAIVNKGHESYYLTDSGYFSLLLPELGFEKRSLPVQNSILYYDSAKQVYWTRHKNFLLKESFTEQGHKIDTVLREEGIMQILPDAEGNTWIATNGNGLYKYFVQDFNRCGGPNMRGVMAILKDSEDNTWIGTSNQGIIRMQGGKVKYYHDPKEPYRNVVVSIQQSKDGIVWVATQYGLGKYLREQDTFQWFTANEGLSGSSISSIQFDKQNNVWIGTLGAGLNYFDGKTFRHYGVRDGLLSNIILSSYYAPLYKTLFIGTEFGLAAMQNDKVVPVPLPEIENTNINAIHPFRDSLLLLGTGGSGVLVYQPQTNKHWRLSSKEGLVSDFIYFAAADPADEIWIGSEKGVSRLRLRDDLSIESSLHYDHSNGLEGVEANQNAFHLGTQERYFGMIDGLYDFNESSHAQVHSFPLHLTRVALLFGEDQINRYAQSLQGFFKIPAGLRLPPDQNHVTFTFNRVDKRFPNVKFKYRLVNYDRTWSSPSSQQVVTYSHLAPGRYTFEVMATNNRGSWDAMPLRYEFVVQAPFYQTAVFVLMMVILVIGATLLFLYLRVRYKVGRLMEVERIRTREQEALRKEIARDFHDEMGNQLSRIINYVSLLRLNGQSGMTQNDLFSKVENSAKYLYSGTRDFIWSIDPVNDELSKLFIHLRDFGEKLFEEKSIHFRAYNEVPEKVLLSYGFSRQANLIFKEAMTNAFKYSQAHNVKLSLEQIGGGFVLSFEDDGIGFNMSDLKSKNGLQNISDRANRIKSVLRISSEQARDGHTGRTSIVLAFTAVNKEHYGTRI